MITRTLPTKLKTQRKLFIQYPYCFFIITMIFLLNRIEMQQLLQSTRLLILFFFFYDLLLDQPYLLI